IEHIEHILDGIQSLSDPVDKASALEEADDKMRSATGTKRSFKMEIRLVQDTNQRSKYSKRLKKMENELRTLKADLKALQAEEHRGELFVSGGGANGPDGEQDPTMAGNNMLNEASRVQDKTQDALGNTKSMIAQTKEVGVATLEELQRQREVLNNIDKEADRMGDNLARAEALVKQFGKRMASDKFIQCFAVLNCLLFVGVVVWAIFKGKGDDLLGGNPDAPADPVANRMLLRGEW
ncbi:MAG: SNARE protein, partial [Bacillariaceae sp.]